MSEFDNKKKSSKTNGRLFKPDRLFTFKIVYAERGNGMSMYHIKKLIER